MLDVSLLVWIIVFIVSLAALIKSADFFTQYSEKLALALKISPFVIGVSLIAFGTSIPELATALIALLQGDNTIAVANSFGSNIANVLLILGVTALVVNKLKAERNIIDIDLPLLFLSTVLLAIVVLDRTVTFGEGVILILGYAVYMLYVFQSREKVKGSVPSADGEKNKKSHINITTLLIILISIVAIYISAEFTIKAVINIGEILGIATGIIAITAIAIGTSMPEMVISLRAAMKGKHDIAIGNVVGSNIFNALLVVGIPSLFTNLTVGDATWRIGFPFLIISTLTFIFSGITRRVYRFEGAMYIVLYILFIFNIITFT
jgi:cation:H+ antiporter